LNSMTNKPRNLVNPESDYPWDLSAHFSVQD